MRSFVLKARAKNARNELVMLLLASMAVVTSLTYAVTRGEFQTGAPLDLQKLLLMSGVTIAGLLACLLVWRAVSIARHISRRSREENAELRRNLATLEAVIRSEPHVLLYWEQDQEARVIAQTLTNVAGLPNSSEDMLRFGKWLEQRSATQLKAALDELFRQGRSFNIILRTKAADHVEAEGRASGGRAILRLSEVAGYKRDLARIIDQHQWLARDIRSMRALLNALPMPVWLKTRDGRLTWVNRAYVQAVESQSEDEVLTRQIELLDSRERQRALRTIAKGEAFHQRMQIVVGAERRAHDIIMLPFEDTIAGAAIDAAAVDTAKGELERHITAYDRTLDHVATGVAMFDREQHLKFYNEAFTKLWPLDDDWLHSNPAAGSVLDRLRERGVLPEAANYRDWKARILTSFSTEGEQEDWWLLPDGRIIHMRAEKQPDGGVTYLFSDESERLALESRYNALINVQRETLDSLKEGVAVFAADGRLKLHNSSFASIWKLSRDMLGTSPFIDEIIAEVARVDEEAASWRSIRDVVTSYLDTRQQRAGQMVRADNSVIDFATTPLPDGGTLVTFADVTVSKRYERALIERNEALEVADRLKNQFIGHVSYELRTPLTNIIGFSDMLSSAYVGPLNTKQREYLDDISSSSRTLLAIIDDILDLATIDAGALELRRENVIVEKVIDAAIQGIRDRAARSSLTIDIGIESGIETIYADEQRVRQVLYNLLSNAVGFSHEGGTVRVTCLREHGGVVFEVEDEGVGIPKEQQSGIFERFISRSQGSKHRGAGLGLSIAKSIVELHGGAMSLHSEPGKGTRVSARFPQAGAKSLPTPAEFKQAQRAAG